MRDKYKKRDASGNETRADENTCDRGHTISTATVAFLQVTARTAGLPQDKQCFARQYELCSPGFAMAAFVQAS